METILSEPALVAPYADIRKRSVFLKKMSPSRLNRVEEEDDNVAFLDIFFQRLAITVWQTALHIRKHANELATRSVTPQKQAWGGTEGRPKSRRENAMDLTYITERILSLWFPYDIGAQEYRMGHQQVAHMLQSKHGSSYMVFNLSEPRGGTRREHVRVREVGWPPDLAPPLERLCSVCKDIDSWLSEDSSRIAVLHARGNRERIGVIVAAYMHYSSICGSPEQALDRFAMKRYLDHKIGELELPSNKRYVNYFSGLLSGCIRINSAPLYLTHVTVLGAPSFEPGTCGCRAFIKVYEGLIPVYTSGVHTVSPETRQFTVTVSGGADRRGLQLRGDILLKCYHRHYCNDENSTRCSSPLDSSVASGEPPIQRELIFSCQFHTCAVTDHTLSFTRQELDGACNDLRFPLDGAVELHFSGRSETPRITPAPTPAVPVDNSQDPVTRWDSYEHLDHPPPLSPDSDITEEANDAEVTHTYGPLDGSLYATVAKKEEVIASPHTVSMDSGISSAGNGLASQGPCLDQHRELDKLLSEMLMTVRDIEEVPYHARTDSRPFSYGLASPRLVRKLSNDRPSPVFHEGNIVTGSISQDTSNNLTWLQRQQQKLRDRREVQLRWEREPAERSLLSELRVSQTTTRSPSRRTDGYASDTSHLRDDEDFSVPLHINTTAAKVTTGSAPVSPLLPHRSSSRRHPLTSAAARARSADPAPFSGKNRKYSDSSTARGSEQDSGLLSLIDGGDSEKHSSFVASTTRSPSDSSEETAAWPPPPSELQARPGFESLALNLLRDEGYSWRTTSTTSEGTGSPANSPRPQTPAFPVHPRTPYSNGNHSHFDIAGLPPKSPTANRKEWTPLGETLQREHSSTSSRGYDSSDNQYSPKSPVLSNGTMNGGQSSPTPTVYYGTSRRSSIHSNGEPPQEVSPAHVKFVRDTNKYWYKATISREEAINMLKDRPPGTFVVRDSNSFPGAFGLALKVATPPPNAGKSPTGDPANELVRHFLIEPTSRGVRLKGCSNEPVFSSLSALVYQHTLTPLALPCKLVLPESDPSRQMDPSTVSNAQLLLAQGAACNVLYLKTVDTESLTGPQAVVRAITQLFSDALPTAVVVHFKVSTQGITLTDNKRQQFFRRHYPVNTISYCGLDPDDHRWSQRNETTGMPLSSLRCFGFVAREPGNKPDNQCHLFAELEPGQPANAIVNFVAKVMLNGQTKNNIV
ncbi:tensin isoform X3 [Cimex lectularius]|uniref:Tensin n=1 Tax=Cimex lectularius TaxID=79782 RepID=A0A8I6SHN1_CIMLE|nr:tensin isoform X3 [Cimex lectularius]